MTGLTGREGWWGPASGPLMGRGRPGVPAAHCRDASLFGDGGVGSLGHLLLWASSLANPRWGSEQRSSKTRSLSKLWRNYSRVEIIEEEALYEGFPASYFDLIEDVGEVILHGVLGDVEGCGYLFSRGTA